MARTYRALCGDGGQRPAIGHHQRRNRQSVNALRRGGEGVARRDDRVGGKHSFMGQRGPPAKVLGQFPALDRIPPRRQTRMRHRHDGPSEPHIRRQRGRVQLHHIDVVARGDV